MANDLTPILRQKLNAAMHHLPRIVGTEAVNWFKDRFRQQNWVESGPIPWKPRKPGSKRNRGRAILTDTGRLKRSPRIVQTLPAKVIVGSDVPYAKAHNYGFKGVVSVSGHTRKKFSRQAGSRKSRIGGSITVKPHSRFMNLPQRKFMGNSPVLRSILTRSAKIYLLRTLK